MGPLPPEVQERNRELLAERLHWPDGALAACRELEAAYPDYSAYWGRGWCARQPGYYASRTDNSRTPTLYGATADELGKILAADAARQSSRGPWA